MNPRLMFVQRIAKSRKGGGARQSAVTMVSLATVLFVGAAAHTVGQDFTGPENKPDGKPDILWRRKSNSDTWLWQMDGLRMTAATIVGWSQQDTRWKIDGTGDFNGDHKLDILWRHEKEDWTGVWFMDGTNRIGTASIHHSPGNSWRIAGAGDFGQVTDGAVVRVQDGKADIVWQENSTGYKAIWFMDGTNLQSKIVIDTNSPSWRIVAVGDFGSSSSDTKPDGRPDWVLSHFESGRVAIWYIDGARKVSEHVVWNRMSKEPFSFAHDKDLQIVGAADYTLDGKTDLLVRHGTDGRNFVWALDGPNFLHEHALSTHVWDLDWRMGTQELTDSRWRLQPSPRLFPMLTVSAVRDPAARLALSFVDYPLMRDHTFTVRRGVADSGKREIMVTGITANTYTDTNVTLGVIYDYEVRAVSPNNTGPVASARAAVDAPVIDERGRVLLIVEQGLASRLDESLDAFIEDLVGDGWRVVVKKDEPRHQDGRWTTANARAVRRLKSWIKERYDESPQDTRCVILLGHVAVPYAGTEASDNHIDHAHPWTADAFYGDVIGPRWKDTGDGQFKDDYFESPLELAVGRIDLSRLPSFGVTSSSTTATEASLVRQYLAKNHRYRHKLAPFPLAERAIFTSYFPQFWTLQDNAKWNAAAFFGNYVTNLIVAEPFHNNAAFRNSVAPTPCVWAFASGPAGQDRIYNMQSDLTYTTAMLKQHPDAPVAFWSVLGSYFADFNADDNLCRALLATPNYGLAVLPSSSGGGGLALRLEEMALGAPIGVAFANCISANPVRERWLNLQGDPTLRLHTLAPPRSLSVSRKGKTVSLSWNAGEEGAKFHVYRAATKSGPFTRVTADPISETIHSLADDSSQRVFMVRAVKLVFTGRGSYWNISQGATGAAN